MSIYRVLRRGHAHTLIANLYPVARTCAKEFFASIERVSNGAQPREEHGGLDLLGKRVDELWSGFRSSKFNAKAHSCKVFHEQRVVDVLRHEVCDVLLSLDLQEFEVPGAHTVLDPKIRDR